MSSRIKGWQGLLLGMLCVALMIPALWAQDDSAGDSTTRPAADPPATQPNTDPPTSQPAKPRPEIDTVIDKMIEAAGGEKLAKVKSSVMHASVSVPAQGIHGVLELYFKAPSFIYFTVNLGAAGKQEFGHDGETFWSSEPNMGPRTVTGKEKDQHLRDRVDGILHVRTDYPKRSLGPDETVNGRACYALLMTDRNGGVETWLVDQEDWRLRRKKFVAITPMGGIPTVVDLVRYEDHGGIAVPMELRTRSMGFEHVVKITGVEFNVEIPADRFALPPDIQALVDKEKAAGAGVEPTSQPSGDAGGTGGTGGTEGTEGTEGNGESTSRPAGE